MTSSKLRLALLMVLLSIGGASLRCAAATTGRDSDTGLFQGAKASAVSSAVISTGRLDSTPDMMQSLPEAKLPLHGYTYCGPVAVSNSIIWLSKNGYPALAPAHSEKPSVQGVLTLQLARYFRTTGGNGTSPTMLLNGIDKYVRDKGYKIKSLQYEGWERHPRAFSNGVTVPEIRWIEQGLIGKSAVWLMIGWYRYSPASGTYSPFAQHWVSVVGCGQDRAGKPNPDVLIIHDPAPRNGASVSHDYVTVQRIQKGVFARHSGRQIKSAIGWYKLGGDLKVKKGADCGILDGAVVMKLE